MLGFVRQKTFNEVVMSAKRKDEEIERLQAMHAERVRVMGVRKFSATELTARLRGIEPSLRVEEGQDKYVIYADRPMSEGELNAIVAAVQEELVLDTT